jgi:hypothetical protein
MEMFRHDTDTAVDLAATIVDPLTDPVPPEWDAFVSNEGLPAMWRGALLRTAAWCAATPVTMVLVHDGDAPLALFHVRHLGVGNPARFARPGRTVPVNLAECRTAPVAMGAGMAFAAGTSGTERAATVRAFERALRRRGTAAIGYRELRTDDLAAVPTAWRLRLRLSPTMVVHNEWSDPQSYRGGLAAKWRSQLKKITATVDDDPGLRLALAATVEPADAAWLAEQVRRRHVSRAVPRPPVPAVYFEALAAQPGIEFLTYRDAGGRLIAYSAVHDDGRQLLLICWGSRSRTDGGRVNLYFDQYQRLIDLMITRRRERLVLGKGMQEIKARYGARPTPLWAVVGPR